MAKTQVPYERRQAGLSLLAVFPGLRGQGQSACPSCNTVVPIPSVVVRVDLGSAREPWAFRRLVRSRGAFQELEQLFGPA